VSFWGWLRPKAALPPAPSIFTPSEETLLRGVHPDLVRVVARCRREGGEFRVLEGLRSQARQRELVAKGASKTMNSRHLTGHAVDLGATVGGQVRWDWPLYHALAARMKAVAEAEGVKIEWGGDWKSFPDGPHYQLPRA
jgi:peptidoglycan LD-endopeptidase CwlK